MFFTSTKSKFLSVGYLFFFVVTSSSFGQIRQTNRKEFLITRDIEAHAVVSVDTLGLILYRSYTSAKENHLELTRLDTTLQQIWRGFLSVSKEFTLAQVKANQSRIYFLFKGVSFKKGYLVYSVNILDGSYLSFPISNAIPFNATEFVVNRETIIIGGYFNYRPIVIHHTMRTSQTRALPGLLGLPGEITQIKAYADGGIDVIISAKNLQEKKCIWIHQYDVKGDLIKTVILEPEDNKNLIFGRAAQTSDNHQIIAGVYGKNSGYARGIFVAGINPYGEYAIHYYNFADLQNFFHYLKAPQEKRIKAKIERRKIKGKKNKFNYRFLVQQIIPYQDQFVMLGEAFYPKYSNRNSSLGGTAYSFYSPWTIGFPTRYPYYNNSRGEQTFDGFQYTHAVLIGFDKNGNLQWDNSFEINGFKSLNLEQFVKILEGPDQITLAYVFENTICSKIIKDNNLIEGTSQSTLKPTDGNEIVPKSTHAVKLEYWYGKKLFVHGIQEVRVNNQTSKVFFINKISGN